MLSKQKIKNVNKWGDIFLDRKIYISDISHTIINRFIQPVQSQSHDSVLHGS